ncbi:MAG: pentapeptide repeat-containing protein [Desulfocapsaceae bacterium]|jgi:uncharacterized protein YjbI with pentapeptide repeats|nr:pentapeptide repeat-containing protein [Desulfocapsaceae bacterium]
MTDSKNNGAVFTFFPLFLLLVVPSLHAAGTSVEIQENIDTLVQTKACVDCNLAGAELNRLDLSGADLRGADLSNATFFLADLSQADLRGAILRGTQFGGADLADADLRQADLRGVKIAGAYLVGCRIDGTFTDVSVTDDKGFEEVVEKTYIPDDAVPKKTPENQQVSIADRRDFGPVPPQVERSQTIPAGAPEGGPAQPAAPPLKKAPVVSELVVKYETTELKESSPAKDAVQVAEILPAREEQVASRQQPPVAVDRSDGEKTGGIVVTEKEETGISDPDGKIQLENQPFAPVRPDSVDENEPVKAKELAIDTANQIAEAEITEEAAAEVLPGLVALEKQVKKSRKCYGCNLAGSDFSGVNLDSADLEGSDFTGANLENTDFEDANLKGVSFKNARLQNAKFSGADLYKADFSGADLSGAELKDALIDETNFQDAVGYDGLMITGAQ